jgi:hypothetical protein
MLKVVLNRQFRNQIIKIIRIIRIYNNNKNHNYNNIHHKGNMTLIQNKKAIMTSILNPIIRPTKKSLFQKEITLLSSPIKALHIVITLLMPRKLRCKRAILGTLNMEITRILRGWMIISRSRDLNQLN